MAQCPRLRLDCRGLVGGSSSVNRISKVSRRDAFDSQRLECGATTLRNDGGKFVVASCHDDEERVQFIVQQSHRRNPERPVHLQESSSYSSSSVGDDEELSRKSRRQMLCGICAGIGLRMVGENSEALAAEPSPSAPVPSYKNCGGSGAVLCDMCGGTGK